jgi:integrase
LSLSEDTKYLEAAAKLGAEAELAYNRALTGTRATKRVEQPRKPDSYLLRDVASVLVESGLRPEECFRLKWAENIRDGTIVIHTGKGTGSRRRIPMTDRVQLIVDQRLEHSSSEWIFPAATRSGHIEASTLKKQHAAALAASGIPDFVLYTLRHTCITTWAKHMDPYILHRVAGHTDMNTAKRYVRPSDEDVREAMSNVHGGHSSRHSAKTPD